MDIWGSTAAPPDGTIITSLGPICFLTQSDRGFARGNIFRERKWEDPTFCHKIENTFFSFTKLKTLKICTFPGPDLYSSVASSLNHYYSANISACEPPQQKPPKKTKQTKNEVIDTVESSV